MDFFVCLNGQVKKEAGATSQKSIIFYAIDYFLWWKKRIFFRKERNEI